MHFTVVCDLLYENVQCSSLNMLCMVLEKHLENLKSNLESFEEKQHPKGITLMLIYDSRSYFWL